MRILFSTSLACSLFVGSGLQPAEQIVVGPVYVSPPCDQINDALPFLKGTDGADVPKSRFSNDRRACEVQVPKADCASWHPSWECHALEENNCLCSFSTACHGMLAVLQPPEHVNLQCRPDEVSEMCICFGFQACKSSSEWECHADKSGGPVPPHTPISENKEEREFEDKYFKDNGVCKCKSKSPLYTVRLNKKESHDIFSQHPFEEVEAVRKPQVVTGVAGKEITKVEKIKDRVKVDIKDKEPAPKAEEKGKGSIKAAAGVATTKRKEASADADSKLVEHCVVTDGWPRFTEKHWMMMGIMLLPLWLVTLIVLGIRSRGSRAAAAAEAAEASSGGGAPNGGHSAGHHDPGKSAASAAEPPDAQLVAVEEESRRPPMCVYYSIVALFILLKLNLTVIVSSSHLITAQSGAASLELDEKHNDSELGGSISGLLIAVEPLGGILGIFVVARFGMGRPREMFLGGCLMVCLGSMGFFLALQYNSMMLMLFVRAFSGISEGCVFLGQTYLAFMSSADVRTEIFATCEFGTAAGLAAGPVLTSLFNFQGSLAVVAGVALVLLCILILSFPENELIGAEQVADRESKLPCWQMDSDMDECKWVAASVSWTSAAVRPMLRLAWESSAVMVLSAHFCLGYKITGYLIAVVIAIYFIAQTVFVNVCARMSDHRLVRRCESLELIGVILMLRWPGTLDYAMEHDVENTWTAFLHIACFVVASGLIYSGNCLLAAPMNAWSTKLGPRKSCVLLYNNLAVQVGSFAGSYLSRFFAGWDPHQNTLAFLIIPLVLSHGLLSETAFKTMKFFTQNRSSLSPDPAA